jgi:hypothetical protein
MKVSITVFCALLSVASASIRPAFADPLPSEALLSPTRCMGAARSAQDWGWIDRTDSRTPLSSIVSAVNRHLRVNAGRLPATDIQRLRASSSSDDACIRELAAAILRTQDRGPLPQQRGRLAVTGAEKSVTRRLEKQSPTSEALSP